MDRLQMDWLWANLVHYHLNLATSWLSEELLSANYSILTEKL